MTYTTQLVATIDGLPKLTWIVAISVRCPACGATARLAEAEHRALVACEQCGFRAHSERGDARDVAAALLNMTSR